MPIADVETVVLKIAAAPLAARPDGFTLPTGPGLGVEVDLDAVHRLAKES